MKTDPSEGVVAVIDGVAGRSLPGPVNIVSAVLMGIGLIAFLAGWFGLGDGGAVAWGSFLVGLLYTLAIAQGGVMFSVILSGTWGRWGRPVKRIGEAFAFYLPVGYLMLIVFLILGLKIYAWHPNNVLGVEVDLAPHSAEAIPSKEFWLSPLSFVARQILALGLLIVGLLNLKARQFRRGFVALFGGIAALAVVAAYFHGLENPPHHQHAHGGLKETAIGAMNLFGAAFGPVGRWLSPHPYNGLTAFGFVGTLLVAATGWLLLSGAFDADRRAHAHTCR